MNKYEDGQKSIILSFFFFKYEWKYNYKKPEDNLYT